MNSDLIIKYEKSINRVAAKLAAKYKFVVVQY